MKRRLHLAFVGPVAPWRGGIAQYNTLLYRALERRARVDCYSYARQYPAWLYPGASDREPAAERCAGVEYGLDGLSPWSWLVLFRRLARERPTALVLTWAHPFWTPHLLLLGLLVRWLTPIRLLFIAHNVVAHDAGRLARLCSALVLRLAHGCLVHSTCELRELARFAPGARATWAAMPPLLPPAPPLPGREESRAALGLPAGEPLLLFYGFVRPYKGLSLGLQALAGAGPRVRLLVAGECWGGTPRIEREIAEQGLQQRVTLIDRYATPEETVRYFAACDAVFLPYRSASGSGILPLAYAQERPVIATRVGSLADCVLDGRTGLLADPHPEALAAAIRRFFDSFDRDGAPARIRDYLDRELSWDALVDRLLGLIPSHARGGRSVPGA